LSIKSNTAKKHTGIRGEVEIRIEIVKWYVKMRGFIVPRKALDQPPSSRISGLQDIGTGPTLPALKYSYAAASACYILCAKVAKTRSYLRSIGVKCVPRPGSR